MSVVQPNSLYFSSAILVAFEKTMEGTRIQSQSFKYIRSHKKHLSEICVFFTVMKFAHCQMHESKSLIWRLRPSSSPSHPPTPLAPAWGAAHPKEACQIIMWVTLFLEKGMTWKWCAPLGGTSGCWRPTWCTTSQGILVHLQAAARDNHLDNEYDRISRVNCYSYEENLLPRKNILKAYA